MIRIGFWFSLIFILAAPEGIRLLDDKWIPMTTTFQLMIVYTLFDPLISGLKSLLTAVGKPEAIARTRILQFVVFMPSIILLGNYFGIEGVAIAADIMIATGTFFLFKQASPHVDYSRNLLWLWPTIALLLTTVIILLFTPTWQNASNGFILVGKSVIITAVYWGVLLLMERKELLLGWEMVWGLVRPKFQSIFNRKGN